MRGALSTPVPAVAFFDLDRTLIPQHTAILYLQLSVQDGRERWTTLLRAGAYALGYFFNQLDIEDVARGAIRRVAGNPEADMADRGRRCVQQLVMPRLSARALEALEDHRRRGHAVCILTASLVYVVQPLAEALRVDCMGTRLEVQEGLLTGETDGPVLFGRHKVEAAQRYAAERGVGLRECWFYSDSASDVPLLEAVGNPVAVNADPQLQKVAKQRGWTVTQFR